MTELILFWLAGAWLILALELWTSKQRTLQRPSVSFTLESLGLALAWPVLLPLIVLVWLFTRLRWVRR